MCLVPFISNTLYQTGRAADRRADGVKQTDGPTDRQTELTISAGRRRTAGGAKMRGEEG